MNEEYTPDIVSIVDEDGKEHIFEELDRIETDGGRYVALDGDTTIYRMEESSLTQILTLSETGL